MRCVIFLFPFLHIVDYNNIIPRSRAAGGSRPGCGRPRDRPGHPQERQVSGPRLILTPPAASAHIARPSSPLPPGALQRRPAQGSGVGVQNSALGASAKPSAEPPPLGGPRRMAGAGCGRPTTEPGPPRRPPLAQLPAFQPLFFSASGPQVLRRERGRRPRGTEGRARGGALRLCAAPGGARPAADPAPRRQWGLPPAGLAARSS